MALATVAASVRNSGEQADRCLSLCGCASLKVTPAARTAGRTVVLTVVVESCPPSAASESGHWRPWARLH
jgi:hypothetical protein